MQFLFRTKVGRWSLVTLCAESDEVNWSTSQRDLSSMPEIPKSLDEFEIVSQIHNQMCQFVKRKKSGNLIDLNGIGLGEKVRKFIESGAIKKICKQLKKIISKLDNDKLKIAFVLMSQKRSPNSAMLYPNMDEEIDDIFEQKIQPEFSLELKLLHNIFQQIIVKKHQFITIQIGQLKIHLLQSLEVALKLFKNQDFAKRIREIFEQKDHKHATKGDRLKEKRENMGKNKIEANFYQFKEGRKQRVRRYSRWNSYTFGLVLFIASIGCVCKRLFIGHLNILRKQSSFHTCRFYLISYIRYKIIYLSSVSNIWARYS